MSEFAERIRAVRERLGLTKADLARLLNVNYASLMSWERGEEPKSECPETVVRLLETDPDGGLQLLRNRLERTASMGPPLGEQESPDEWVRRLRDGLGLTQAEFADLLGIARTTVSLWESARTRPEGCSELLLDLLEHHFEGAAPLLWPQLLQWSSIKEPELEEEGVSGWLPDWPPGRIEALRRSLRLSKAHLAVLLRLDPSVVYLWEQGRRAPGPCAAILLLLLETHGPKAADILGSVPFGTDWPPERVAKVREMLGLSLPGMATLFGIEPHALRQWERRGFRTAGCHELLYSLLESRPEEAAELLRALPRT